MVSLGTNLVSKGDSVPLRRSALLLHFFHNKALNDIAFLDIIVVLDAHAALIRGCNFLHIVLEALEGIQVTLVEYDAVTDYANLSVTLNLAVLYIAACNRACAGDLEHLTNLCVAENNFLELRLEHALHGLLHLLDK